VSTNTVPRGYIIKPAQLPRNKIDAAIPLKYKFHKWHIPNHNYMPRNSLGEGTRSHCNIGVINDNEINHKSNISLIRHQEGNRNFCMELQQPTIKVLTKNNKIHTLTE
jgi:hypothetical protein